MQICGTVRRPVLSIISSRWRGSRSTRIFSISVTPFDFSSISARTQNGHTALAYIRIFAIYFSTGRPACCQAPIPPPKVNTCSKPFLRSAAAALPERLPVSHTTITGFALCFSSSAERAQHVRFLVLGRLAHVQHQGVLLVHQQRRLEGRNGRAAAGAAHRGPDEHRAAYERHPDEK